MPIRMVPDENRGQNNQQNFRRNNKGGSGLGGILSFLPMIISFLIKKPKLFALLLAIGAIWYFTQDGCTNNVADISNQENNLTKGATLDPEEFDKAEVFTPLAETSKNILPEQVSLEQYCPSRKNQGYQGSCVGWASSYAARTIMEARATGKNPNSVAFSPSSLYNQIALPDCQGAYINKAMDVMKQRGVLPWKDFPYDETNCSSKPDNAGFQKMGDYRTRGYNRLTINEDPRGEIDLLAIKQNLAQGAPVVIGMMVGGSFMQGMQGQDLWLPTSSDYNMRGFGGHAMCIVGYDDYKAGGAFQLMNSWGNEWGNKGFGWVRYNDFQYFTKEAYGLYPMGDASKQNPTKFQMQFGLVSNEGGNYIPIQQVKGNYFETTEWVPKMTKFKIEVSNTIDCYTYIFGAEIDNSSYVLFPYTAKHSPYCGITGTRIFPRDHSLLADDEGSKDYFAILVTKQPIDYESVNRAINNSSGNSYEEKINKALSKILKRGVQFLSNAQNIGFTTDTNGEEAVLMIIGVNKEKA